ncbi:MAG: iron complex outermembrane receptor protein [Planctomycetota bacterium]|jgi:iron complex outermembrane receptor protein
MRPNSCLHSLWSRSLLLAGLAIFSSSLGSAQTGVVVEASANASDSDFTELSLAELLDMEITVATRAPQKLSKTSSAVYVLSGDEIRRAGHRSLQEAMRMVPGFYVSHWRTGAWDVTSRGFGPGLSVINNAYFNQLLVMIDGVVVYTPLLPGVWWPFLDMDMDDIERIEIVRGPGGLAWGANAVHGVVNVITKNSADTQGLKISGSSSRDEWSTNQRYGGTLGKNGHYRVWSRRGHFDTLHSDSSSDDGSWGMSSGGARFDWMTESGKQANFIARVYDGEFGVPYGGGSYFDESFGGNFAWSLTDPESGESWKASYAKDKQKLEDWVDIDLDIVNLDYQRSWNASPEQLVTYGMGYEFINSRLTTPDPAGFLNFNEPSVDQHNLRAFALSSTDFPEHDLNVSLGIQAVHTKFEDLEFQPSVRLAWSPNEETTVWTGISRAVRTPSLEEATLDVGNLGHTSVTRSETLVAYEIGVRRVLSANVAVALSTFYNDYKHLSSENYDLVFDYENTSVGSAVGAELELDATLREGWTMRSTYTFLHGHHRAEDGTPLDTDEYHPTHILGVRSYYDLSETLELDAGIYLVDGFDVPYSQAEYTRADLRLGWKPTETLRFSLGVQGLNDSNRSELGSSEVRRQWILGFTWTPTLD